MTAGDCRTSLFRSGRKGDARRGTRKHVERVCMCMTFDCFGLARKTAIGKKESGEGGGVRGLTDVGDSDGQINRKTTHWAKGALN